MKTTDNSTNFRSIWKLIISDWERYNKNSMRGGKYLIFNALTAKNHCFAYSFWLRLARLKNPIGYFARMKHYLMSRRYGIRISPFMKLGEGLYIGHGVGIIIHPNTEIGNNCNISQFLTIGSNKSTPAKIGNNVYIGPNVCIVEDVVIGDNVKIGAGTVVINSIPDNCTSVGNPNRIIRKN